MSFSIINNVSSSRVPMWGNDKKFICVHYLGCVGENFDLAPDGTGAHFTVFYNGEIHQRCSLDAVVWAVGTAGYYTQKHPVANNYNTISIEMCVKKTDDKKAQNSPDDKDWHFTEATQMATAWLVRYLMDKLDIPITNVLRHFDIVNKVCPAPYVHNNSYLESWTWGRFIDIVKSQKFESTDTNLPKNIKTVASLEGLTELQKIKAIAPFYQKVQKKTGMLASVGLAQFCLESGYGTTDLAEQGNNLHGMKTELSGNTWKGSTWDGKSSIRKITAEHDENGKIYYVKAFFRKYACIEDSIKDRAYYFIGAMNGNKKRYPKIAKCKSAEEQVKIIKNGGYATDVNYVAKLLDIIKRYDLTQFDGDTVVKKTFTKKIYRVQVGFFMTRGRSQSFSDSFTKLYHVDTIVREKDGGYMIQAGAFESEENAKNRVTMLKSLYNVEAFYYSEEVEE